MAEKKQKFYVVWVGATPGIYLTWDDCVNQVHGFPNAKFKAFERYEEAEAAFVRGYENYISAGKTQSVTDLLSTCVSNVPHLKPELEAIAVDAACSGNPGKMEYQGVYVRGRQQLFHVGPFEKGTNNVGEFLAIVHGLAFLKQRGSSLPIYSDSANAISWVKQKKCKTKLEPCEQNREIFNLVERAEKWLNENEYPNLIIKWNTKMWGEIPADFGRK